MDTGYDRRHQPSFFFPIALITVGVVWLLVNNGTIDAQNIYRLLPLWPVLLIVGGLSLMLRRLWWPLAGLLWLLLAAGLIWALVAAPNMLPQMRAPELRHQTLSEPVDGAASAAVRLDLSINPTTISPAADGSTLVSADLYSVNDMELQVSGADTKNVRLRSIGNGNINFNFFSFSWLTQDLQPWNIGLAPDIPMELHIDASTGSTEVDLTGIELESLTVEASTGSMNIRLPEDQESVPFRLDASTGSMDITVPENTGLDMNVDGSTGSLTIDIPDGASWRVEVTDGGPGSLNLPAGSSKVSGDPNDDEGVYESRDFQESADAILITLDLSTGSVTLR